MSNGGRHPQPHRGGAQQENAAQQWLVQHIADILQFRETEHLKELIDHLQRYVQEKCGSITSSQLRNIFSKIKSGNQPTKQKLQLVRPQLAYVAARQATPEAKDVVDFLERIISKVETDEQAAHFVSFVEAIVAYHKFYHPKK